MLRHLTVATLSLLTATSFAAPEVEYQPLSPPLPPALNYAELKPFPAPAPVAVKPVLHVTKLRNVKVTACSPQDPIDLAYYAKHGYEGAIYGVAADLRKLPRGTLIRVPGYRGGAWHRVDSAGGSIIRRSSRAGRMQIDVKFKTLYSSRKWGAQTLDIDVIYPAHFNEASELLDVK